MHRLLTRQRRLFRPLHVGKGAPRLFSVPYEEGWSATVNGKPAEVEKVSVGFMAVKVPAGTSQIRFNYRTPGLTLGILAGAGARRCSQRT